MLPVLLTVHWKNIAVKNLEFFVAKNHLGVALFLTAVFLAVILLDHVQHALLKGLSTQRVWHCACAYALPSRDQVESASKKKKKKKNTPGKGYV